MSLRYSVCNTKLVSDANETSRESQIAQKNMKQIVMVLGVGINERGWAKFMSKFGRVTLIQMGLFEHVEIWEHEHRIYCGPETQTVKRRHYDEILFGLLGFFRVIGLIRHFTKGVKIDLFITGFYNIAFSAAFLRLCGKIRKRIFFVTDYLPAKGSWLVRLHRFVTGEMTKHAMKQADEVWSLSPRIHTANVNPRHFVVPICINKHQAISHSRDEIGYIGYPSYDHALEILFEICNRHNFRLNVIGDSPYLQSIKHLAPSGTVFHGLLNDEEKIGAIFSKCFCGYAIYRDTSPASYSYYGFPSKTFYCFASNVPIVITNVAYYNHNFEKNGVGRVVKPVKEEIEHAILQLKQNYETYSQAIDRFRLEWNADVEKFHQERLANLFGN